MAKRPQPRSKGHSSTPSGSAAPRANVKAAARPTAKGRGQASSSALPRSDRTGSTAKEGGNDATAVRPPRRSTYVEAVAVYEQGVQALQRHRYREAEQLLESVLTRFPEEKELHERVRLYLNVCHRQAAPNERSPETVDQRLYAATLSINEGRYEDAISHLRLVRDEDPDNDYALYMLAVAHAQRGEHAEAVAHLERSIALNPENRALARRDPDLDSLREDESFQATLETPARPAESKRPLRPKSLR